MIKLVSMRIGLVYSGYLIIVVVIIVVVIIVVVVFNNLRRVFRGGLELFDL